MATNWCTYWPDSLLGVDYSLSCLAHDNSYMGDWMDKVEGDLALFLDVWATAQVTDKWWKRAALRCNACVMCFGVSTFGWAAWGIVKANQWLDKTIDPKIL